MTTETKTEDRKPKSLPLVFFPNARLYEVSKPIRDIDQYIRNLAADMIETMNQSQGVGLAAIQVGIPLRLFVMKSGDKDLALINPVWFYESSNETVRLKEGCLSLPSVFEEVERLKSVLVEYQDVNGVNQSEIVTGVDAHIVQHEIKHLDGKLFIEHLPLHKRDTIRTKMKQRARLTARIDKVMRNKTLGIQEMISAGIVKLPARPGFRSGK